MALIHEKRAAAFLFPVGFHLTVQDTHAKIILLYIKIIQLHRNVEVSVKSNFDW